MDTAYSWLRRSVSKLKSSSVPSAAAGVGGGGRSSEGSKSEFQEDEEEKLYGITDKLIELVKSFSLETFRNFSLPDEGRNNCDETGSENLRKDLSDWQEKHAMLVLTRVKELGHLRFRLCPRYLKEWQFWRIYFKLVESYVARYELHAVQVAKLKQVRSENEATSNSSACEVEMSEAKFASAMDSGTSS